MNYYVDICFRLINFFSLGALFVYGFWKYVLPTVYLQLQEADAQDEELLSKQSILEADYTELDESILRDEKVTQELHEKILLWSASINSTVHARSEEKKRVIRKLEVDRVAQENSKALLKLQKEVARDAIIDSQKELQSRFKDIDEQKKYIDTILMFMKESS